MPFQDFTAGNILTAAQMDILAQQSVIVCTSGTRPSAPIEGMTIKETDTDLEYTYSGAAWIRTNSYGQGTDWTPTVTQSGAVTVTTTYARYFKMGRFCHAWLNVAVTGSGTGANGVLVSLPLTASGLVTNLTLGTGFLRDNSAAFVYPFLATMASTTTFELLIAYNGGTTDFSFLGTTGFTAALASSDRIQAEIRYETAS